MSGKSRVLLSVLVATFIACSPYTVLWASQDRVAGLRSRFANEPDPVRKAKILPQLGNAEFQEIAKDFTDNRLSDALTVLEQYRDDARTCEEDLDARNVDAEQHPGGFKQLEFSLRESLRRLDDLLVTLTVDEQAPFEAPRKDIDDMNRHLIHELFPREPRRQQPNTKSAD